jgi:STE24 endopeptidase
MTNIENPQPAILTGEDLAKARAREQERVISSILRLVLAVIFFLVWVYGGLSSSLRDALGGDKDFISRVLFIMVFSVISSVVEFPISYYFGFLSGKKYGLLKQNFSGWLLDNIKDDLIDSAMSGLLLFGFYAAIRAFPTAWFPVAMAGVTVFFAVFLFISPFLARMRFKSAPLDNPDLEARVKKIFDASGVKLTKTSRWLFGEKTKQGNAALVQDGLGSEVLISDTLMASMQPEGIEVVLAHEIGHKVHKDLYKSLALTWLLFALIIAAANYSFSSIGMSGGLRGSSDIATLPVFFFIATLIGQVFSLITNANTRAAEYAADKFALEITKNPIAFEAAFRSLAKENLSDPNPPAWVEFWLHSHPTIEKRIAAARAWAATKGIPVT